MYVSLSQYISNQQSAISHQQSVISNQSSVISNQTNQHYGKGYRYTAYNDGI